MTEKRNIVQTRKIGKLTGLFILCANTVIEGQTEGRRDVTGRRERRRKQLVCGRNRKIRYCKLKESALDLTVCRTRSGRGCGPVVRQTK